MDEDRSKPWTEMTFAERMIERDRRAHEDELQARRDAAAKREGDETLAQHDRPRTWADCPDSDQPCPWVGCRWHLYLDVSPHSGAIKFNFPDLEPWELKHSCALDLAERGGMTLTEVSDVMNVTRERVRQLEQIAIRKLAQWKRELR